ncbi:MAG: hypothetical protein J7574_09460 [Flavobacterium sp.]|uniref:hypothetical protein n=1 Tax=Flavobacterium sp. TaxID=239 RepID=UPI001B09D0A1|nr:hypothetical protein [Flavobacterium sp.]MBO9584372.1 hypothetical protein [Flavobacterium sp.]
MIVNGTFSVECDVCGKVHNIGADEAEFEITETEERAQGQERARGWGTEIDCDGNNNCDNQIEIECEVWEYPQGQLSHQDTNVTGGTLRNGFSYDLGEHPEE